MKNTIFAIIAILLCFLSTRAEERHDSLEFLFPQSISQLDTNFKTNGKELEKIRRILSDTIGSHIEIKNLSIIGAASPEGSIPYNQALSDRRALEIANFLESSDLISAEAVTTQFVGRDWITLREMTQADVNIPYRHEVIQLLDEIIANDSVSGSESPDFHNLENLKSLHGGVPYAYLYKNIFPSIRRSRVNIDYFVLPLTDFNIGGPTTLAHLPILPSLIVIPQNERKEEKNFYMDLKTNLLYDAAALPTIGIDFYLGKNLSVGANWTYGWWDRNSSHRYWRAYGGDINLRWWFGKAAHEKPLTGHHIGIFGGITTYDFEFGGSGRMGGLPGHTLWDRCMRMAGVEYGYSLPIARRLNLDFTLGVGYLGGKYIKYIPKGNGYLWQSTNKLTWFGPIKAEISLVWLIGSGNYNANK